MIVAFQYLESTVFIQYKRKVELYQSQQYVPLSSFVFSIERKDTIVMGEG